MSAPKLSISKKLCIWVLICSALGFSCFCALFYLTGNWVAQKAGQSEASPSTVNSLQQYITSNKVSTDDKQALDRWCEINDGVEIEVFVDGTEVYHSFSDVVKHLDIIEGTEAAQKSAVTMQFEDRKAEVIFYDYLHWFDMLIAIDVLLSALLFVICFFYVVQMESGRVRNLAKEVQNLEGGDLTQAITIEGSDEVTALEESMEGFRLSMVDKLDTIRKLEQNNREMSAEIAHDLRTPLTSMIMYLDFARSGIEGQNPEAEMYLDKARRKSADLKELIEKNFSFTAEGVDDQEDLQIMYAPEAINPPLIGLTSNLESEAFRIHADIRYERNRILVDTVALNRVFNNLLSNMLKYADRSEEVYITCFAKGKFLELKLENRVRDYSADEPESTGFGARILRRQMAKMQGEYDAWEENGHYVTVLRFLKVG